MFTEDIKVYVEGYFSGPEDYTFEVRMTSSTTFQWRKYRTGDSVCKTSTTGPWCAFRGTGTLSEVHATLLEHGVYIMFATLEERQLGISGFLMRILFGRRLLVQFSSLAM